MAKKKRPGIMLYFDDMQMLDELNNEDFGEVLRAGMQYAKDRSEPKFDGVKNFAFQILKRFLDRDAQRYEAICAKRAIAAEQRWSDANESDTMQMMQMHANDANACFASENAKNDANDANNQLPITNNQLPTPNPTAIVITNTRVRAREDEQEDVFASERDKVVSRSAGRRAGDAVEEAKRLLVDASGDADRVAIGRQVDELCGKYDPAQVLRAAKKAVNEGTPKVRDVSKILRCWRRQDEAAALFEPLEREAEK